MKKIIILPVTVLLILATTSAQSNGLSKIKNMKGDDISYRSKDQFERDFGHMSNVNWRRSDFYDEATFAKDGHTLTAFYDADGELVGTTEHKHYYDIPAKARKFIDSHYKDYNKVDVILFDDNEANETDMVMYDQQFADADNYFVDLSKGNKELILQVDMAGDVYYFERLH